MPPFPDDGSPITNGVMLVGEKEFMRVTKEKDTPCYALVVRPQKHLIEPPHDPPKVINVGPKEVRDLLEKYKGIVAGSQPKTLPPRRGISHYIDLILGATLPNKAVYKISLEKNEEIARKIEDLLAKWFIRKKYKTMCSPCSPSS